MSRLKSLLRVADPSPGNTQQPPVQVCTAVAQHTHTTQQKLLHVARPSPRNTQQGVVGAFQFSPPGDPANDAEAVAERAAIMAVENGWDDLRAIQEARWQSDRERCWKAFLANAKRVLDAPQTHRDGLLAQYQAQAATRYGEATGLDMAGSLRSWVEARKVH